MGNVFNFRIQKTIKSYIICEKMAQYGFIFVILHLK